MGECGGGPAADDAGADVERKPSFEVLYSSAPKRSDGSMVMPLATADDDDDGSLLLTAES